MTATDLPFMRIMLDTNVCIALLNKSSAIARERLQTYPPVDIVISSIVYFELAYGAERSAKRDRNMQALAEFASGIHVLDFTHEDAAEAGNVRSYLEVRGQPIGAFDTLIAGQARARSLILATNNVREFGRIPNLIIEDWIAQS